jgi:predicted nucleotidyltransferase
MQGHSQLLNPTAQQIEVLKIVADWADRFPCIRHIYIFGSYVRGAQIPDDIDIAVAYTEEVSKRTALQCYTDVNFHSTDLEQSLGRIVTPRVAWTGLRLLLDGYDHTAWGAIHAGTVVHCHRKAKMIWTEPKPPSTI